MVPRRPWRARAAFIVVSAMLATACSGGSDSLQDAIDDLRSGSDPASGTGARGDDDSGDDPATDPGGPIPALEPDTTPLPIDPAVRIGRLDNGLTYYVRSNDAPGGSLELRLVVNAGSLQEPEPGRGIAHFLEHMLFNGTERFPGNELDRVLRELGTQIGADLNAFTSFDETVYFLSVSTTDPDAVSTAFDVLHEWATAATLVPADVIAERGVVRQELRESIETGDGQIFSQFTDVYTADTAYAGFDPIGTAESVEAMIDTELRDFYDAWYRPENMAVVAVGDLPADELEAAIADRFSTMSARSGPATRTEAQATFDPVPSSYVFTHPDAGAPYLSIDFPVPGWDGSTVGGERLQVMQRLIASMVSGRLRDAHTRGEVASATEPFLEEFSFARELHFLGSNFQGDDLAAALEDYLGILLGVEEAGFDESELARAVDEARAELDFSVDSAGSRQDFEFADSYTSHFLEGAEIDAAGSTADRLRALLDDLTAADVTAHFRWLMRQGGPIVIAVGSDPADVPTVAELDAAIDRARPSLGADTGEGIESLMAPPEPADVITTRTNDDIGSVEWTFANGAGVSFVESTIAEGQVDVLAAAGGGRSLLEPGEAALASLAVTAVLQSGLGDLDPVDLDRFLGSTTVSLDTYIDEAEEGFFASSSSSDLEILFQLIHLQLTEPRVDDVALEQALTEGRNLIRAVESDPFTRTIDELNDARFGSDPYQQVAPDPAQLDGLTAETALAIFRERLGKVDDLVVAVVGDADADVVELLARRYLGTLPAGPGDTWIDRRPAMPAGVQRRDLDLQGDVTAAGIVEYFELETDITPHDEVVARVLETIANNRLFLSIREDLGASYGGSISITPLRRPDERFEVFVQADGDPDRIEEILSTVNAELTDLAFAGPTVAELDQAFAIVGDQYAFVTNFDSLSLVVDHGLQPSEPLLYLGDRLSELDSVTPGQLIDLAAGLFATGNRIEVTRTVG